MRCLALALLGTISIIVAFVGGALLYTGSQGSLLEIGREYLLDWLDRPAADDASPVRFTVRSGESASDIAERLEKEGLIANARDFRLVARLEDADGRLAAGEYELSADMRLSEMIEAMVGGQQQVFTVVEGWRIAEIADALEKRGLAQRDEFVSAARAGSFPMDFLDSLPDDAMLEGYLFPDTYQFLLGSSTHDLIQIMLNNFDRRFTPEMRQMAADQNLTLHEIVTLASIVEREAMVADERRLIAAVFLNRLAIDMPLQACATVQYALLGTTPPMLADGYWKGSLLLSDLEVDSPYNTYRRRGLPPGPIASPGIASIQAVLQPDATEYFYFVARPDGSHAFAVTFEEHMENVARYQPGQ